MASPAAVRAWAFYGLPSKAATMETRLSHRRPPGFPPMQQRLAELLLFAASRKDLGFLFHLLIWFAVGKSRGLHFGDDFHDGTSHRRGNVAASLAFAIGKSRSLDFSDDFHDG